MSRACTHRTINDNALTTLHWRLFEAVGDTLTDLCVGCGYSYSTGANHAGCGARRDASNNRFTTLDTRLFQSTPLLKQLCVLAGTA